MTSTHLNYMIEALHLEVAAIRRRGGTGQTDLRGGERIGVAEGNYLYRFPISEDLQLRDETPVRVVCGQSEVDGTIVSILKGFLIVALEEDMVSLARTEIVPLQTIDVDGTTKDPWNHPMG